ncbi:MAG TPA: hypothetical protein VN688_25475 [Gemmataceae bacterium]|nr:hypothetical protein [Gemmataceae bacterium]
MRAVTATATIRADHMLMVQLPADISPGVHQVVVVLQETAPENPQEFSWPNWQAHNVGPVDPSMTFRREDIYDDDGR